MPPPFTLTIHPEDIAAGVALIGAAMAAAPPGAGVVAAWDFRSLFPSAMKAIESLLRGAADRLDGPCECFCRGDARGRSPGLIPTTRPDFMQTTHASFEWIVAALAQDIGRGAAGLLVSEGYNSRPGDVPPFSSGILHLHPNGGAGQRDTSNVFILAGFPSLILSRRVGMLSAHEILDRCESLTTRMVADRHATSRA